MLNILIIDDSLTIRKMLEKILLELGQNVIATASSASEGIELYKKHRPDFVTMDVNMPEMNGIEALKIIREDYKDAKILMLTSKGDNILIEQAIKYGAKGYVLKPPSPKKLKDAIAALFPNEFKPKVEEDMDIQNYESGIKDTLTDLYTAQYMHHTIQHLIDIHDKNLNIPLSMILIDIKNLDDIASQFGTIQRDVLLTQIADEIQDIVEDGNIPIKLSNKEFAVFLVGSSIKNIESTAKKIKFKIESIKNDFAINDTKLVVATNFAHHKQYEKLIHFLERADKA